MPIKFKKKKKKKKKKNPNQCYQGQAQIFCPASVIQLHDLGNDALFLLKSYTSLFLKGKNHICGVDLSAEEK